LPCQTPTSVTIGEVPERSRLADDEGVAGGLNDFAGHGHQLVDVEDPGDQGDAVGSSFTMRYATVVATATRTAGV
jgi:hypothetical protein